jgi:hypothetical protein
MRAEKWREVIKNWWPGVVIVLLVLPLMLANLLEVPRGLTVDEAAFGLNASLLGRTGHDENGRLMPVFVLSLGGRDWRQPVTQYYQAAFFKLFGGGVYNLRLSSVVVTMIGALLMYELARLRFKKRWWGVTAAGLFLLTPMVWIQSHMGLDNNVPVVFSLIWLLGLETIRKEKIISRKTVVVMAIALGLAFYSYKGMRVVAPVWALLTIFYLVWGKKDWRRAILFGVSMVPFVAVIPWLESRYAGAIMGGASVNIHNVYQFFYPYLSYFDPTFLWITGDATVFHSTGRHGMLLLATMPLVVAGIGVLIKKGEGGLILAALGVAPMLMGAVDSVHRASRIMAIVPLYIILMIEGIKWFKERIGKGVWVAMMILVVINFGDFFVAYNDEYAKVSEENFGNLAYFRAYEKISQMAMGREVLIARAAKDMAGESGRFFDELYFEGKLKTVEREEEAERGWMLSRREEVEGWQSEGCFGERQVMCVLRR